MKEFKIEYVDPKSLVPYEANAKIHNKKQIEALAAAIKSRGFDQPITTDAEMVIITGHGRAEAAIYAGLALVPVIVRDDLSDAEVKAKRLEDNRLSSTDYDTELLQEELSSLSSVGFDEIFGFDDRELEMLLSDPLAMTDDDDFIDDIGGEVERQEIESDRIRAEVEESTVGIATLIGFKDVPVAHGRIIANWFAKLEEKHGCSGVNALIAEIASGDEQASPEDDLDALFADFEG